MSSALRPHGNWVDSGHHRTPARPGWHRAASFAWNNRHHIQHAAHTIGEAWKHRGGQLPHRRVPSPSVSSASMRSQKSAFRHVVNPEGEGAPIYRTVALTTGYKKIKQKSHHIPKISKVFRKKVDKVIHDKQIHGHFHQYSGAQKVIQQYSTGFKTYFPAGGMGQQYDPSVVASGVLHVEDQASWLFGPDFFLHCASVLFHGKGITAGSSANLNCANQQIASIGNMPIWTDGAYRLKCTVKSSHVTYRYKSLQKQAVHMEFLVCKPRRKSSYNPQIPNPVSSGGVTTIGYKFLPTTKTGGNSGEDDGSLLDPLAFWSAAVTNDNAQTLQTLHLYGGTPVYNPNLIASNRYVSLNCPIGLDPLAFPTFRSAYAFERIKITLQPGQEYILKVQGPSDMEIDSSKWATGTLFQNIQMYSRAVVVSLLNELSASTTADPGIAEHIPQTVATLHGVGVEATFHVKMSMPEEAVGLPEATIGALVNLTYRKPYYVYVNDYVGTAGSTADVFNAEQPLADATI